LVRCGPSGIMILPFSHWGGGISGDDFFLALKPCCVADK